MRGRVLLARITRGRVQTRQVPVGPVMVPESVRPWGSAIVGQPVAATTVAGQLRAHGGGGSRQRLTGDVREIDAAALEEVTFLDQPRGAATTFRAYPAVGAEALAVEGFELGNDAGLQRRKIGLESLGIHGLVHCAASRRP